MKLFLRRRNARAAWVVTLAVTMPLALGGSSALADFTDVSGFSSGTEHRNGGQNDTFEVVCENHKLPDGSPNPNDFRNFTNNAIYTYPAVADEPVPAVSYGELKGPGPAGKTYRGPLEISWSAEVWDGPYATTRGFTADSANDDCQYGYKWPLSTGELKSTDDDVPGSLACTGLINNQGLNSSAGSYYSRPPTVDDMDLQGEIIVMKFTSCTIVDAAGSSQTVSDAMITLQDRAHAGCFDLNAAYDGGFSNDGVSDCASNYEITSLIPGGVT